MVNFFVKMCTWMKCLFHIWLNWFTKNLLNRSQISLCTNFFWKGNIKHHYKNNMNICHDVMLKIHCVDLSKWDINSIFHSIKWCECVNLNIIVKKPKWKISKISILNFNFMSLQKLRNRYWNISLKTCDNNVVSKKNN